MNILPKKRWHVRTKQNIARVRKDEAEAAEQEKKLQQRIKLAEQETRTALLKKRARSRYCVKSHHEETPKLNEEQKLSHVNFFQEIEEAKGQIGGTNKEYELEKKKEKEKFEKQIGLLTYLGQSVIDATDSPWYLHPRGTKMKDDVDNLSDDDIVGSKHKSSIDPLNDMKRFLSHKKHQASEARGISRKDEKNVKKHKTEKFSKSSIKAPKSVEQLRAERLQRERIERERAKQLLARHKNGAQREEPVILDERQRRYNCQYNPHLSRQPQLNTSQKKTFCLRNFYHEL